MLTIKTGDVLEIDGIEFIVQQVTVSRYLKGANVTIAGQDLLSHTERLEQEKQRVSVLKKSEIVADQFIEEQDKL